MYSVLTLDGGPRFRTRDFTVVVFICNVLVKGFKLSQPQIGCTLTLKFTSFSPDHHLDNVIRPTTLLCTRSQKRFYLSLAESFGSPSTLEEYS